MYSGVYAVFYYMQACYPYLKETKGSVINFASGAGLFGNYGQCAYAAAKEGIRGLSRVAATEWGPDGINVNIVCPLAWTAQLENFQKAYPEAFKANVKTVSYTHLDVYKRQVLLGEDPKVMTGKGAGLTKKGLQKKVQVIREAVERMQPDKTDAIDVLSKVGGLDICLLYTSSPERSGHCK